MTQEEKDKLFKYLCMALPYGLKVHWEGCDYGDKTKNLVTIDEFRTINDEFQVEDCKPYLRPMESMTEEEKEEYELLANRTIVTSVGFVHLEVTELIEWLNKKHFDFMGLIPIDCAIEVTDENNPYKE